MATRSSRGWLAPDAALRPEQQMSANITDHVDIVVTGSGLAGLTTVASILRAAPSLSIAIVDRGGLPHEPADDGPGLRVAAITPASEALFDRIGVWSELPETHAEPFVQMRVWDAATACGDGVAFDSEALGQTHLGHIVDNDMLRWKLFEHLRRQPGVRFVSAGIADALPGTARVTVALDDGAMLSAQLLIGADGRSSAVRDALSMPVKGWSHDQLAVVVHLHSELPHRGCALQRFLPEGPLALLPLPGKRVSLVWSTTPAMARELNGLSDEAFSDAVTEASDAVLGRLTPAGSRAAFPLVSQYAENPVAQRTVLVGDAAHAIHPLAGQGANLGFGDAQCIAAVIASAIAEGGDFGDAPYLRRFRRSRKADNLGMLYGLDFLNRLFAREHGLVANLRRAGMRWFSSSDTAKRLAASHAMGIATNVDAVE